MNEEELSEESWELFYQRYNKFVESLYNPNKEIKE